MQQMLLSVSAVKQVENSKEKKQSKQNAHHLKK